MLNKVFLRNLLVILLFKLKKTNDLGDSFFPNVWYFTEVLLVFVFLSLKDSVYARMLSWIILKRCEKLCEVLPRAFQKHVIDFIDSGHCYLLWYNIISKTNVTSNGKYTFGEYYEAPALIYLKIIYILFICNWYYVFDCGFYGTLLY